MTTKTETRSLKRNRDPGKVIETCSICRRVRSCLRFKKCEDCLTGLDVMNMDDLRSCARLTVVNIEDHDMEYFENLIKADDRLCQYWPDE